MAINDNKISNVIGTHVPNWLLEQLRTRSEKGTLDTRDNQNLQYLGNKSGWVRLISSININSPEDKRYFQDLTGISLSNPEDLAKNFVLYGGVSKYSTQNNQATYTLRKGFKETYSLFGEKEVQEFGYRPMPGLSRVVIETQGRLGSIRSATIEFKVWDVKQLDVIDALYFKLGYTMFLEWGNTFYYASNSDQLKSSEFFSLDPFRSNLTKEEIALTLGQNRRDSQGNYDGMLGMVSNFSFSYNQEGGYDCVLKLVGLGSLADSIKINQTGTLHDTLQQQIEALNSIYQKIQQENQAKIKAEEAALAASQKQVADAKRAEELNKFKSYLDFLLNDNKLVENLNDIPQTVTTNFFKSYAIGPSGLSTASKRDKDYNSRLDYDYYYSSGNKLYIKKFGVILNGRIDLQKIVKALSWNGSNIKNKALLGRSAKDAASLAIITNENTYSVQTQYFSNSNYVTDNAPYSGPMPYNFTITVDFPITNKKTGKDIVYSVTKQQMLQNVISFFTGETVSYGTIERTKLTIPGASGTYLSDSLKRANGVYNSGYLTQNRYDTPGIILTNNGFYVLELNYNYKIPGTTWKEKAELQADGTYKQVENPKETTIEIPVTVRITDSDLIQGIELKNEEATTREYQLYRDSLSSQNTGGSPSENDSPASNTSTEQTKPSVQFQSSLEATLRSIQIYSLVQAIQASSKKIDLERKVREIDLTDLDFAKKVFSAGIFSSYIEKIINKGLSEEDPIEKNIKYGYNAAILSNKGTVPPAVDYDKLLKSYVLPYEINQDINEGTRLAHPVYIEFGLLLFILNHTCNLYDRKQAGDTTNEKVTPLVYIDYNPETNFCLSHPCQMTTNAMTFMIPFEGTFEDYKKLFYDNVLEGNYIKGTAENKNQKTELFNPETQDTISGDIPRFKGLEAIDTYRGRIMNVLVNIDYLFDIIKQFFSQDPTNSVFLKAFVEQILSDMNKTLGNFNIFRLSYDDAANCLQIMDDQLVPSLEGEDMVTKDSKFDLPIYGKKSIVRTLDLRTDISSKIASTLAISANADIQKKSASSTDGTPFGFINQNYQDRYVPNKAENSDIVRTKDGKLELKGLKDSDLSAIISSALRFNKNVRDFYSTYNPSMENTSHAVNYFIEKMSKNKLDSPTRAAAMIPVSINFTMDGISGFNMMQGFTIPNKFLPYTYNVRKITEQDGPDDRKVGFMVTGNVHTIEANQWTTAIKANMVYLKPRSEFEKGSLNKKLRTGAAASFNPEGATPDLSQAGLASGNNYPTVSSGYRNVKFTNIGLGSPASDRVNPKLLQDISTAAVNAGVNVEITTAVSGHTSAPSRHSSGNAVDIARINGIAVSKDPTAKLLVDKFVNQLNSLGYNINAEGGSNPKAVLTFGFPNHDNHVHVSNLQA